jgi:iron(III) transport system substrate-binding protein
MALTPAFGGSLRIAAAALLILGMALPAVPAAEEVVVYSARNEHLIRPVFERFTEATGIEVRYITDDAGPLIQRLAAEGRRTHADVLLTVDAGNLWQAAQRELLQPAASETLRTLIPAHLRDPEERWFGLSLRVRTLVHHTGRVDTAELGGYAGLADPRWKGRLCLRTSRKVYNQSLVAVMIESYGAERTEEIVRGWVDNLAAAPFANDTQVMEAIAAGQCDVGIVNSYYYGRLLSRDPELPLALHWAGQAGEGVHVNVSGGGIVRHAGNPEGARRLLEWLAGEEAQEIFAGVNLEYPVNQAVEPAPAVAAWGPFRQNLINVSVAGERQREAVMLMDRAGYR